MAASDLLAQVERQTGARDRLDVGGRQAAEPLEEQRDVLGPDAKTMVGHGHEALAVLGAHLAPDLAAIGRELDRVVDQVADDGCDPRSVGPDNGWLASGR